jgi:hypothetical protein
MNGVGPVTSLLLASLILVPSVSSGSLRKVWETDLRKTLQADGETLAPPVLAMRFSPDGKKIAVIGGIFGLGEERKSRLVVLDVGRPDAKVQRFVVNSVDDQIGPSHFGWLPSGDVVYAAGTVIHLVDASTCQVPEDTVFVTNALAISREGFGKGPPSAPTVIAFHDSNCKSQGVWEVAENWTIGDVSLDRAILSVGRSTGWMKWDSLIVDPVARRVLRQGPADELGKFADSGKAICSGGDIEKADRVPATCWDVDTGRKLGDTPRSNGESLVTAARAKRAVVADYRRWKPLWDYEYRSVFKGLVVWDFGEGQELVRWRPGSQTYNYPSLKAAKPETDLFRFAMSPDGQYVAEGGSGVVRLYRIEP